MFRSRLLFAAIAMLSFNVLVQAQEHKDGDQLKGWGTVIDPDHDSRIRSKDNDLTIAVPGTAHDLSVELQRMNAPRVLRGVEGDFVVQVRVDGDLSPNKSLIQERAAFHGAGLLLMKDDRTYVRLEHAALFDPNASQVTEYPSFELREDGNFVRQGQVGDARVEKQQMSYLRLERHGDKILGAVSADGMKWVYLDPITAKLPKDLRIGVAAVSSAAEPFSPRFSNMELFQRK